MYTVYGTEDAVATVPGGYQTPTPMGSNVGGVNPAFFQFMPAAQYDSWLTVGEDQGNVHNQVSSVGIQFDRWSTSPLTITDGAIFWMNPSERIGR